MLAFAAAMASGCANTPDSPLAPTPILEKHFGSAVNTAKAQQTLNPSASQNTDPVAGVDGEAANEMIDRYHEIFKAPPPPITNINIGGGIGGSGGSGR